MLTGTTKFGGPAAIAALLSFNAGFVDTVGFLGLQGLFTAHVTGNFVTLGAAIISGSHGIVSKMLALPEFVGVIALARLAATVMRKREWPVMRILLSVEVLLLLAFCVLAVHHGPFADTDTPIALLTGFAGVAAMALQNALQRVHLSSLPPTTLMTGNTTQATIDVVDLMTGAADAQRSAVTRRLRQMSFGILTFALGCAAAAVLFWLVGFWALVLAVAIGATAALIRATT